MAILTTILVMGLLVFLSMEFASISIYGWFLSKTEVEDFLKSIDLTQVVPRFNYMTDDIIYVEKTKINPIFKQGHWSPFSKYYMNFEGNRRVWKYGKLHKQIETWFKLANENLKK